MQENLYIVQYFLDFAELPVHWFIRISFQGDCYEVEVWSAGYLMDASLAAGGIQGLRMTPIHKLL